MGAPERASTDELIQRTREVASRWKVLYLQEEQLCDSQRRQLREGSKALHHTRGIRDAAIEKARMAQAEAAVAKHEKARWRHRADAQSNARIFLELQETRTALQQRDAQLADTKAEVAAAMKKLHGTPSSTTSRMIVEETLQARARRRNHTERPPHGPNPMRLTARVQAEVENAMRLRAEADGRTSKLKVEVQELRTALVQQQAAFPPDALNSARYRANALEVRADRAEQLVGTLRQQCETWKAKAREATRSERLARMTAADATPQRAAPVDAETKAAIARQAEVDHWRSEAASEVARQRTFQKELWTNEAFTAPQKQHIISMLRAAGLKDQEDKISPQALLAIAAGSTELPPPS